MGRLLMLGVHLAQLLDGDPPGVADALDLADGFDNALVHGLARLGEERGAALAALAGAVATTPLGARVGEAVEKVAAGSVTDEHLAALAGARTALFGAVHDALLARLDTALGRTRATWAGRAQEPVADNLLAASRSWLGELAITGWRGVDHDLAAASDQALEPLLADPARRRLALLLDGLAAELRGSCPVATMEQLPARRWADLWARAVLLAQSGSWPGSSTPVSGRLLILGVDVHEHGTAVQVQVHGVLEGGEQPRLVRTSVAAPKVDTIAGKAVWRLLQGYPVLLGALAGRLSVEITDMALLDSGDLVWQEERASAGEPADPFATARLQLDAALAPAVPPLDRHPVRIAEPVLLEGYTSDGATITLDGHALAVDDRLPSAGPLTRELVAASTACIGLIRWDGRWLLQPLAVQATVKRKPVVAHSGDWATDTKVGKTGDAVAVLKERAGRLLRK